MATSKRVVRLYLLKSGLTGYDTYNECVVAACTAREARLITPGWSSTVVDRSWVRPDRVIVRLIGTAARGVKAGTVLSESYQAG